MPPLKSANNGSDEIEVEVETEEQVREALAAKVDIIMLDNMSPELMADGTTDQRAGYR